MAEQALPGDPPIAQPAPADPAASPYNADALAATVRAEVRGAITDLQAQSQQAQQQQAQQAHQQQAAQRQWSDPVAQTVRPYIEPVVQALSLQVQAANDRAEFYDQFPEARPYRQDIKSMFDQLMQQGRPMEHEAIWHYYKGKNAEAFAARDAAQKQADLAASATRFASVGGPSAMRPNGQDLSNFNALSLEQKRDALKGVSF